MHSEFTGGDVNPATNITHRALNVFAGEKRHIYFFSDAPHLIKTARNCLSKSGAGSSTRLLWNNGYHILWCHIANLYDENLNGLHLVPKLSRDHIKLNSFNIMNVKLAAQVLSNSVATALATFGPEEAKETAKFCYMMDRFFDCLNIRNKTEHIVKKKASLRPFDCQDDERLTWLITEFLQYFEDWSKSIEERPGKFSSKAKASMFISRQTYEGLQITAHSAVGLIKFLLQNGVQYVLTERFCQDPLENYFGHQRAGRYRHDNPTLNDFGFNDNMIRNQKKFRPIAHGNSTDHEFSNLISDEPLPTRKKKKRK